MMESKKRTAFILGVTADIGLGIAERLLEDGWRVVGAGRDPMRVYALRSNADFAFIPCDLADPGSVRDCATVYGTMALEWSLFVSAAGTMEPIGRFFETDFDDWAGSVQVNMTNQLRLLHHLWPNRAARPQIMYMAGGGTNNPMRHYSAYCMSKIALIKMCELIDDEEPEANIFIIGPGYVRTRIHGETLRAGPKAGQALDRTRQFLEDDESGTSLDDIYAHMVWCMEKGRSVAGGRNFSTVHDPWRDKGDGLADKIRGKADAFRLRRHPVDEENLK